MRVNRPPQCVTTLYMCWRHRHMTWYRNKEVFYSMWSTLLLRYWCALITMCLVPPSLNAFSPSTGSELRKKQKSMLTVCNRVVSHLSLILSSQVWGHISAEKVGTIYVSQRTVALHHPPSFPSSLLPTASSFCDDLSRPIHTTDFRYCCTESTSHNRSDLVGVWLKCRV